MFARPELRVRSGSMPWPSSAMDTVTEPPHARPDTSTLTAAAVAFAWRAMLDRPSRTTATTSSPRWASTRPSKSSMRASSWSSSSLIATESRVMSREGAKPRAARVSDDSRRMRSTRPTAWSLSRRLCTIARIWRTASSMEASDWSRTFVIAAGSAAPEATACFAASRRIPVAKSCWIAKSWRSRPMRSRSSRSAATSSAWRAEASSRASVACEARDSARESSDESNSGAPIWRSRMRTPEETPRERRGA